MVVWGGSFYDASWQSLYLNTGGRYDPATDSWTSTSTTNAPTGRADHTAVWTGSEMVVWGGYFHDASWQTLYLDTGGRYDPATDTWTPTSTTGAPSVSGGSSTVWTGQEMIVWGGNGPGGRTNTGGRYDPSADRWIPTSVVDAPSPRRNHAAVWTGREMAVWGGEDHLTMDTGGRYDPVADSWTGVSTDGAPVSRESHALLWTGQAVLAWGGETYPWNSVPLNVGGRLFLGSLYDDDDDGYTECQGDCGDGDPAVHPGAVETCDGVDSDCDGIIDDGGGALCDDGDVCTDDTCNGATGCAHAFRDTIPPVVTCPQPITTEFMNASGAVVGFAAGATDVCAGPIPPTCAPASGSTCPIGATTVACSAADPSGNTGFCSFPVTVLGPRGVKQDVLAELTALRGTISNREDRRKLDEAIRALTESLDPASWVDETHVRSNRHGPDREKVFREEKRTVETLLELKRRNRSGMTGAVLQGFIDRIVRSDRVLAFVAIQDASVPGHDPRELTKAYASLTKGDRDVTRGRSAEAIDDYLDSWEHAMRALPWPAQVGMRSVGESGSGVTTPWMRPS
jgi:hypothetical protein